METVAKHVIFYGQVQGVGFRFTAFNVACRYQLTGQVRNAPDGTVDMIAQGPADDINNCIKDIEDSFKGYVKDKTVEEIPLDPNFKDFKITF